MSQVTRCVAMVNACYLPVVLYFLTQNLLHRDERTRTTNDLSDKPNLF